MKNRLGKLMRAYRERPEAKSEMSLWQFVRAEDPYLFSHHPAGAGFREHVWGFRGLYFCKGCVVTFAGALFGAAFFAVTRWLFAFTDFQVGGIFVLLLLPTLIAHLLELPRWCRHSSRFLLGFLMISAFLMLFVTDSWFVRFLIAACYLGVKIPLERKRNREHRALF